MAGPGKASARNESFVLIVRPNLEPIERIYAELPERDRTGTLLQWLIASQDSGGACKVKITGDSAAPEILRPSAETCPHQSDD